MTITVNGATNTLTAPSGLTIAGNTTVSGSLAVSSGSSSSVTRTGMNGIGPATVFSVVSDAKTANDAVSMFLTAQDSASNAQQYASIRAIITDPTSGSEDASLVLARTVAGTITDGITIGATGTAVTGLLDLSAASSGQIKFPATQNASADANTLDDYEEGSWTPALINSGSNTYTTQTGSYTKIGRTVTIQGLITVNVATAPSGTLEISGLPFTSSATQKGAASLQVNGVNASATTCWMGSVTPSSTVIRLYTYAAGALTNPGGYVASGCTFGFSATYEI